MSGAPVTWRVGAPAFPKGRSAAVTPMGYLSSDEVVPLAVATGSVRRTGFAYRLSSRTFGWRVLPPDAFGWAAGRVSFVACLQVIVAFQLVAGAAAMRTIV